jgi:O-antigen/teichoic acid export membrane protein
MSAQAEGAPSPARTAELGSAAASALRLTGSLGATWAIAVVVRLALPRLLGPDAFGTFTYADNLTASAFVLLTFGVDTYIRKEVGLRPSHASDFFGALTALRLAVFAGVGLALLLLVLRTGASADLALTVGAFALGQLFFVHNNSLAALLHARGEVVGLTAANIASKLLWGAGMLLAVALELPLWSLGAAFALTEAGRSAWLHPLARRHLGLRLKLNPAAALAVLGASLPFYLELISQAVCTRLGAAVVGLRASPAEVGYFGAAQGLAGMALLLTPLMSWVLLPYLSRAAARSEAELLRKARGAQELVIGLAVPVALALALGAEEWIGWLFGEVYAPAAGALRVLAPSFVLTYLAIINATCLVLLRRPWHVTWVALGTLLLSPTLSWFWVPAAQSRWDAGGAGLGAAAAMLITEALAVVALVVAVRGRTIDRGAALLFGKLLGLCLLTVWADRLVDWMGPGRLALAAAVYTVLALAAGALPIRAAGRLWTAAFERGRGRGREGADA